MLKGLLPNVPLTGDACKDAETLLTFHGFHKTLAHSRQVSQVAQLLAFQWGVDPLLAARAGWLHDISVIVPPEERIALAEAMQVDILSEERYYPMILHQKLSAVLARHLFKITSHELLSAVECHTTLKANASSLDKVVFIADKLKWDQAGDPPYLQSMLAGLELSLEAAAFSFLDYLWREKELLPVLHPWMVAAYVQLHAT
jgi:predicted HD superfamily hydrolase involved in NAD metabolism